MFERRFGVDLRALADVGTDFSAATFSANHM